MSKRLPLVLHALLFPKKRWIFLLDMISLILLIDRFIQNRNETIFTYVIDSLATYSLIITFISLFKLSKEIKKYALSNDHVHKYYADIQYRMKIKLYVSVSINMFYAVMKLVAGYIYQSIWDVHLGTYYVIICLVRCILLRQINYNALGKNKIIEYKKYQLCSYFVLALNLIFTGIVILMVYKNYTYQYPGYFIYIAAMYTFYTVISAVYNIIKFRRYDSPLINAINIIYFITALVSILGLQTAMLHQFGAETMAEKQFSNGLTGAFICITIFIVSIYMNLHARKEVNKQMTIV